MIPPALARRRIAAAALTTLPSMASMMGDPRVFFAAERTLLAWVRTGLTIMAFGFVVARFGLFLRLLAAQQGRACPRRSCTTACPTGSASRSC